MKFLSLLLLSIAVAVPSIRSAPTEKPLSVVRVNATNQGYDPIRPWQKKAPYTRQAIGAVLPGNRVLVTAELIANSNFLELERAQTAEKVPATIVAVDYEANLALLEATDANFLKGLVPLELGADAKIGQRLNIWQLESNGSLTVTEGLVSTIEVGTYPENTTSLLLYRLSGNLQLQEASFCLPVVKDGKLAAILMRYDSRTASMEAIPSPVIRHFLKAAGSAEAKEYRGFPHAGISYTGTRDPQFRKFLSLDPGNGGVYVTAVDPTGPSGKAGIQTGDVLLSLNGFHIDQDGNYTDPSYGRISLSNLISTRSFAGDKAKFAIFRDGNRTEVEVTLADRDTQKRVSPPYLVDKQPRYVILGGLIFQELSRQYLKEWGNGWEKRAPLNLVYRDAFQSTLYPEGGRRVVFLSQIAPSPASIGYEQLSHRIVTKVNGIPIHSLDDLAKAAQSPIDGFQQIQLEEDPKMITLDAAEADRIGPVIQKLYGIPSLQNLN